MIQTRGLRGRLGEPLALLLVAVAIVTTAWALLVPPWQVPDETKHFAYVESLAERGAVPSGSRPALATDQAVAREASRAGESSGAVSRKPEWRTEIDREWRIDYDRLPESARRDGGGATRASANSPLYYALEVPPYVLASHGNTLDRLYAMRLWSMLAALAATAFTWLLVGEVMGRRPLLQLAGAAVVSLQPLFTFVTVGITPDGLFVASWAASLWLCARILRRGPTAGVAVGLVCATSVAAAAKPGGYALIPAVGLALAVAAWRSLRTTRQRPWVRWAVPATAAAAVATAVLLGVSSRGSVVAGIETPNLGGAGRAASYLWQFYLPRLPFMEPLANLPPAPAWDAWIATGWGGFGSQEIRFPTLLYALLATASGAALVGALVAVVRARRSLDLALVTVFALAAAGLVLGLHLAEYSVIVDHSSPLANSLRRLREIPLDGVAGNVLLRGRYLLPLLPLGGLAVAAALTVLPARLRPVAVGALLGGLAVLQLTSLSLVAARFYA